MRTRRSFLGRLTGLTLLTGPVVGALAAVTPPARERFHLYLLAGQSNMAGRGPMDLEARRVPERVLKLTREQTWEPAIEPLHFDKPEVVGVGLGGAFAKVLAATEPAVTVGLIPCAFGGSPLSDWAAGAVHFRQAVERTRVAMKDGILHGILWHQGENDALSEQAASTYAERLTRMIADLRAALGSGEVPFLAGELGRFLARRDKDGRTMHWEQVNAHLASLQGRVPRYALVRSDGLTEKGDGVHFDTPSLREFGRRYARAFGELSSAR